MKKIMFNDKYGLTKAVLEGRKTQTRRVINKFHKYIKVCEDAGFQPWSLSEYSKYKVGEVVAIAQKYRDIPSLSEHYMFTGHKGWDNKMFVKGEDMPYHIKITNVRVERLQDISDEDCLAEGITYDCGVFKYTVDNALTKTFMTAKEAYASLIDKVGKKGTWESNPWVFVYEFQLVD